MRIKSTIIVLAGAALLGVVGGLSIAAAVGGGAPQPRRDTLSGNRGPSHLRALGDALSFGPER